MDFSEIEKQAKNKQLKRFEFKDREQMKAFVDSRKVTIELTDEECDLAKESALEKCYGKDYGDFALGNFTMGNKGEIAMAKYLHSVSPYNEGPLKLDYAIDLGRRSYGDGGTDSLWEGWRIDMKMVGSAYDHLKTDITPSLASMYILGHLVYEGFNRKRGRTHYAHKNKVDLYGWLTTKEFYETDCENQLLKCRYVTYKGLPESAYVESWLLNPMSEIKNVVE